MIFSADIKRVWSPDAQHWALPEDFFNQPANNIICFCQIKLGPISHVINCYQDGASSSAQAGAAICLEQKDWGMVLGDTVNFCTLAVVSAYEQCRASNRAGIKWEKFWPERFPGNAFSADSSSSVVCGDFNKTWGIYKLVWTFHFASGTTVSRH